MYKDRKIYLCSFGNLDLYPSAIRLKKQAESFNIFDEIFIYNEYNLPYDEKFERAFRSKLIPSRGFGYWCWKPFILLKTLESMNNNDILFYTDIGCHLNKEGINRFYEYLDIVIDNGGLSFELALIEKAWTKSDLFNYFNVFNDKNITDTFQRPSGAFWIIKNDVNIELINKWLQVYYDDFSLADDTPSKIPNDNTFNEHRHDQSIFSILSKLYNFYTIPCKEFEINNKQYPVNALRDKKDIYTLIAFESCDMFFDKLLWYIPVRKNRHQMRDNLRKYAINLSYKYLGVPKNNDDITLINIKILDNYLKNLINKKIKNYIKYNGKTIDEIRYYINQYKK